MTPLSATTGSTRAGLLGVGLVTHHSRYSFRDTVSKLEQAARGQGAYVFGRIDHRGNALHERMALRPTELLIFGKPQASTPLIQCQQTVGLDLPLKVLVWRDAEGTVWVTYNDIGYIALRHGVDGQGERIAAVHAWFEAVVLAITQ